MGTDREADMLQQLYKYVNTLGELGRPEDLDDETRVNEYSPALIALSELAITASYNTLGSLGAPRDDLSVRVVAGVFKNGLMVGNRITKELLNG